MNSFVFLLVVVLAVLCSVSAIQWKDCGSKGAKISAISVAGCAKSDICKLPKGQNASVTVDFKTSEDFTKATAVVHGIVGGIPIPFPLPQSDGCQQCGISCPVKSGATVKYATNIFVKSEYPDVKVVVKWELKDEHKNDIFCFELPAEVVN